MPTDPRFFWHVTVNTHIFFFLALHPKSDSGISFSKFSVSRYLLKLFYDELRSFSTFFALNFDKKLADRKHTYILFFGLTGRWAKKGVWPLQAGELKKGACPLQAGKLKKVYVPYSQANNLGSVGIIIILFFFTICKTGNSRSEIRFRYFIFEIFGKPLFVEAVLWRVTQFFIIDKCRRQKLCKRAQKISVAAPLCAMASRYNPCE
jgi:hypothetical protein